MRTDYQLTHLDDECLMQRLLTLVTRQRRLSAALLAYLAEVDARGLYRDRAYSSMFIYCVQQLHMSESEAYLRIRAARLAHRYPVIFDKVAAGALSLTALKLLTPALNDANHVELLEAASFRSRQELEELLARRQPKPDVSSVIRKLPAPGPTSESQTNLLEHVASETTASCGQNTDKPPAPLPRPAKAVLKPLSAERYKVQFTASRALRDKLETAQHLLRHQVPDGELSCIVEEALDLLIAQQMKQRFAASDRPRTRKKAGDTSKGGRHIPSEVKRKVTERDGLRCSFVDERGRRCTERGFLEFHHEQAHARGGSREADNIALMCRAHNALLAERNYGRQFMMDKLRQARAHRNQSNWAQTQLFG